MVYVGSTVRTLSERMSEHRRGIKDHPTFKLYELMGRVGVEHFHIELLADFPCERKEQLLAEEGRHIRLHNMVEEGCNAQIAGRSKKESNTAFHEAHREERNAYKRAYHEAHREERKAKCKAYNEAHREEINAYKKAYHEAHREELKIYKKACRLRKKAEREAQALAPPGSD